MILMMCRQRYTRCYYHNTATNDDNDTTTPRTQQQAVLHYLALCHVCVWERDSLGPPFIAIMNINVRSWLAQTSIPPTMLCAGVQRAVKQSSWV